MTFLRLLVAGALTCALVGCSSAHASASKPTPRAQLDWLLSARPPVTDAQLAQHFDPAALQALGGAAKFNALLEPMGALRLERVTDSEAGKVEAIIGGHDDWALTIHTDASGLIAGLNLSPYLAAPTSWSGLDRKLHALAPQAAFLVARGDGCTPLHAVDARRAMPMGSAFKLYVLGALAAKDGWNQRLAIRDDWKSLPSGVLQNEPAGTQLTLAQYADAMISISDNTAADHLIHFLGRDAVEAAARRFGNRRNVPFLTTRELFVLKGSDYPSRLNDYLRTHDLAAVDAVPLSAVTPWTAPRDVDRLEWLASPDDVCHAYAGLAAFDQPQVAHALSLNDGELALDHARFPAVWFKGGSEPGVLTLTYRVRTAGGGTLVAALMLADPKHPIPAAAIPQALALVRGGLQLAAR
jgi:hypothetical protein